jgi:hypothetical protein
MFAIDREIGIERQYGILLIDFGHPHDETRKER